ncbi:cob(I)yrinic acid a,c-diamide adenosyltransferase [Pontiella sulfatireligans]|uniref:Corrinoid adenosyltransferase n=1 Tax=Pontiella sulfatireligans TaxID=2750658 RepID=A0A6C2UGZ7_9BACT|nr:cob(I)yrinic acid a,c-diamide adenosyltransferase [Pontiella sulfatireligans]VGO18476.1 Cob(I)yrinic acid a,c-diamide adenosyltransferase [Pontiella sulfatireligans]
MPKIFTKTGDKGETGRFDGTRVPKNDPIIEVNGTIDECNTMIGVARSYNEDERLDGILKQYQSLLIVAGSEVTNVGNDERLPFVTEADIQAMENLIDELEKELEPLTNFILPAGGKASAHLHLARTASRKVERRLVYLRDSVEVNPILLAYFNRLSDTLFVLARYAAKLSGNEDEFWVNPKS